MSFEFVDFKTVKELVSMEMALTHYNVRLRKVNNSYLRGKCPLPTHASKKSEDSFGVNTEKNAWACQSDSCMKARSGKKGGNVLDFVAVIENCSIRDAALKLQQVFGLNSGAVSELLKSSRPDDQKLVPPQLVSKRTEQGSEATQTSDANRPLDFELKGIEAEHPYLVARGISKETARHFGAGFFPGKGSMIGRVVIPIHDKDGRLVAYAGRSIDDSEPKYKLPAGFHKSRELFNQHRASKCDSDTIIVVEGFFDCMKVHQAEYVPVVALMGSTLSNEQQAVLEKFSKVILMLDGDEPGREAASVIAALLMTQTFVKVIRLPERKQPDQLSSVELRNILGTL